MEVTQPAASSRGAEGRRGNLPKTCHVIPRSPKGDVGISRTKEKQTKDMNIQKLATAALMLLISTGIHARNNGEDPQGFLTYSLPSTTITLEVEAVQEKFYAGPYARFAEKYLGIKVGQKDVTSFQLTQVKLVPYVEADQNRRYSVNVKKGTIDATFLKLSAEGLISFADANFADESIWRFPVRTQGDFSANGVTSNLTSESTTLYRNDKKESVYNKVSVQQNMVVEKSPEKRAAETADMILKLREKRLQIVTGDTDATYSGEAMGAAIDELTRLEKEYMTLFTGYSEYQTQVKRFEIVPDPARESQMYIAFRISDTAGLVNAENMSGRPVVMEIVPQEFQQPQVTENEKKHSSKAVEAYFRIPAICTVRLIDSGDAVLQTRIPVYQLGQESSLPINVIIK